MSTDGPKPSRASTHTELEQLVNGYRALLIRRAVAEARKMDHNCSTTTLNSDLSYRLQITELNLASMPFGIACRQDGSKSSAASSTGCKNSGSTAEMKKAT